MTTMTTARRWRRVYDLNGELPSLQERTLSMAASSPPQVGVPVTKDSINAKLGANSQSLKKATIGLADLRDWGAAYTAEQLSDLYGFTPEEAALLKSALGEVDSITTAVDALQFLSQTWGT